MIGDDAYSIQKCVNSKSAVASAVQKVASPNKALVNASGIKRQQRIGEHELAYNNNIQLFCLL